MDLLGGILGNVMGSTMGGQQQTGNPNPLGALLGSLAGGNANQSTGLLTAAMGLLQQSGGLDGLLENFRRNGMAQHADSWVGTGPNMGISPDQLQQVLGSSSMGQIASQLGLSQGQAGTAMAKLLPELVNQLTPQGRLPEDHSDLVSKALSMLRGGGA